MIEENKICKSFNAFITKMILNASIDYKRKLLKATERELEITSEVEKRISLSNTDRDVFCFVEQKVASNEIEKVFQKEEYFKAMKPLTNMQKQVIDLTVIKELSIKEVARIMKISESNVATIKARAIEKFIRNLKRGM